MKRISLLLLTIIVLLSSTTVVKANTEEFSKSNRIINNSDVITDEQEKDLNDLSIEISKNCGKNIYVYFLSENDGKTKEFIKDFILEYDLSENVYVIGINPYLRTMYIHNEFIEINPTEILEKYSKDDFKNNDFYKGALNTMCGIVGGYTREEIEPPKEYLPIPEIKLTSYITDELDILSAAQEERIQSNSYRLKQNYGHEVYVYFTKSLEDYNVKEYITKVYNDNFSISSYAILVIISLEDGTFHYSCGNNMSLNVDAIYNKYAKEYFHLEVPDYETGVCKLTNGIVATASNMSIEDIENSVISGTTVNVNNVNIKEILTIVLIVVSCVAIVIGIVIVIKKYLIDEERAKEALINNNPDEAFSSLKEELSTVQHENLEYARNIGIINESMDDLYSEAASELTNDELIAEKHIKNKKNNAFDPRFENEKEDDVVISTIDEMIAKVVKESEGTKDYYNQLQAALDVYNSLSFTNRTKLNRSNTSQLETLTRKARMDKEYSERKI